MADSGIRVQPVGAGAMLYDSTRVSNAQEGWLNRSWWERRGEVRDSAGGRGSTCFISVDGRQMVLRHYRRGGLVARLVRDRYWWRGARATRSFREWLLLHDLCREGYPVPVPLAARYSRQGSTYTADILMEHIPATRTLVEALKGAALPIQRWVQVGRCIRRFVDAGVSHADLNAHNILLDDSGGVWLIDFDRARRRAPGLWSDAMVARLYRSLDKTTALLPPDRFSNADWQALVGAYLQGKVGI
jgi:3-deoxy-D-manno-octulosonic acid kinase